MYSFCGIVCVAIYVIMNIESMTKYALVWNTTEEKMAHVAESIREATEKIPLAHDAITTSIGYVFCEKIEKQSYEKWLGCADEAVYQAKNKGRNCVVEYQPEK